jgi:hypothetical protein
MITVHLRRPEFALKCPFSHVTEHGCAENIRYTRIDRAVIQLAAAYIFIAVEGSMIVPAQPVTRAFLAKGFHPRLLGALTVANARAAPYPRGGQLSAMRSHSDGARS